MTDLAIDVSVSDVCLPPNRLSLAHRAKPLEEVPLPLMLVSLVNFSFSRQGTIWKLSDDVLLNIFRHYLDASPQCWPRLIRICRKWRHIVFASQRALRLQLLCTHGTPVLKILDYWPTLPIVIQFGGPRAPCPPAIEDEDDIMAALMQSDRVSSISLTVTNSLLEKLSAIEKPFSELEELVLSRDGVPLTLPSAFRWGERLRTLHLTRAAIPILPVLLSPCTGLVDLQLHKIPKIGYFSPIAFATALSKMTHLRLLSLHFLSFTLPRNYRDLSLQSGERVALLSLTRLKYRGTSEYLDSFVVRIDAPLLRDIDIRFFSQPTMAAFQLSRFINRIEMLKSHRQANILSSENAISISFTQPEVPLRLELQISCKLLARQLSCMAQICIGLFSFLRGVEDLCISVTRTKSEQDDGGHDEWLELTRPFIGTKWVHVVGEHSTILVLALQYTHERMLPAICKLRIREPEPRYAPLRDAVALFMHSRWRLGHIIALEYERLWVNERYGTGTAFVQYPFFMTY